MNAVVFDTHAFVKKLTAVGMPEAQAEVLAGEQARLIDERLATKSDIANLAEKMAALSTKAEVAPLAEKMAALSTKAEVALLAEKMATLTDRIAALATKTEVAEIRVAMGALSTKAEAAEIKSDILKWMFGAMGFQTLVVVGAIFAFARLLH